jgi:hypothetical protein
MRYSFENSFKLYKTAVRTYIRSTFKRRFWFHFQMWGMLSLGLILIFVVSTTEGGARYGAFLYPLIGGLVGGGVVCPILRPWGLRRAYKTWCGETKGRLIYVEIQDNELRTGVEGRSESRLQRSAICNTAEDDSMLLLFLNPKKFIYLSKSLLPSSTFDEIRTWLQLTGAPPSC